MPGVAANAEWANAVGYLPPLLDTLARDLASDRQGGAANAVTEAVVTIRDLTRARRTHERDLRLREDTLAVLQEALDEWELLRSYVSAVDQVEAGKFDDVLMEAADSVAKASAHEPVGKKDLWHHKGWQLPAYIQHIANDIKEKRGLPTSRAIAIAVAAVKRWARGGGKVDAGTKAAASKALAEWEALKAKAHATKEGFDSAGNAKLVKSVDRLQHIVTPIQGQSWFADRYAHQVVVIEGLLAGLGRREPVLAIRTAAAFLGVESEIVGLGMREATLELSGRLERDLRIVRALMESLGYGTVPKRATTKGHKGKFHGMHGVERAVRTRSHISKGPIDEEHPVLIAMGTPGGLVEVAAWTEELHPRANAGQFSAKGDQAQQGKGQGQGQGDGGGSVQEQLDSRLTELGYGGGKSLKEFQQVNGLTATGKIDAQTVDALRSADPTDQIRKQTAASIAFGKTNAPGAAQAQQRAQVAQDQIQAIGYPDSASGISQFQKDYGLPVSGTLDQTTLDTIRTVYGNNARSSNPKTPDFTGIKGAGARVKSRGTHAPPGRKTLTKVAAAVDELFAPADERTLAEVSTLDAALYGGPVARVMTGEPTGTNHAHDTTFDTEEDRQPGGDDIDLDEPREVPPGFREGVGNQVCFTCPHFSMSGRIGLDGARGDHIGACMLHTFPVERLDVCDDWTTLSPEDANVRVYEAELRDVEREGNPDVIVLTRAKLAAARSELREAGVPLHPAHKDRSGLTVEEATVPFNAAKHPRGRAGKWIDVLGRMRVGDSVSMHPFSVTRSDKGYEIKSPLKSETHTDPKMAVRRLGQLGAPTHVADHATGPGQGGKKRMAPDEYFWNSAYKFELRDATRAQQEEVSRRFAAAKLKQDGVSEKHAAIIKDVLAAKKPGSKMSRRSGHGLLTEVRLAIDTLPLDDPQFEFLAAQESVLVGGGEPDDLLEAFVETVLEEAALSAEQRKKLSPSDFAIPPDRYPIHDESHARNALARAAGKPEEARVRAAVKKRYPNIGEKK